MASIVKLPRSVTPAFPDRCVSCGSEQPGNSYPAAPVLFWGRELLPGRSDAFAVNVPACNDCKAFMERQSRARFLADALTTIAGAAAAILVLVVHPGPIGWLFAAGAYCLVIQPLVIWEVFRPRPILLTLSGKTVEYRFRDEFYSIQFRAFNVDAAGPMVWEGMDLGD